MFSEMSWICFHLPKGKNRADAGSAKWERGRRKASWQGTRWTQHEPQVRPTKVRAFSYSWSNVLCIWIPCQTYPEPSSDLAICNSFSGSWCCLFSIFPQSSIFSSVFLFDSWHLFFFFLAELIINFSST